MFENTYQISQNSIIGPKLIDETEYFFANKRKIETNESINLTLSENELIKNENKSFQSELMKEMDKIHIESPEKTNSNVKLSHRISSTPIPNELTLPKIDFPEVLNSKNSSKDNFESKESKLKNDDENNGHKMLFSLSDMNNVINKFNFEKKDEIPFKQKRRIRDIILKISKKIINNTVFSILITLITIYALLADDIRQLVFGLESDYYFDILTILSMGIFTLEIILNVLVKKDYFNTFFFYLDIISTVTMILDIVEFQRSTILRNDPSQNLSYLSGAGRVSKIGTRSIKIVRLIRLFRLVKLYKSVLLNQKKREKERLKRTSMRKRIDSKTMPRPSNIVIRNIDNPIINHDQANQSPNNQNNLPKRSSVFNQNKRKSRNSNVNMNNVSFVSNLSHKWYLNNNKPETKGSFHSYSGSPQKSLKSPTNLFNNSPLNNFSYIKDLERDSNVESVNTKEMSLNELQNDPNKKESAVGKRLSELTTKRVIILVLLLILFVPLFDSGSYFDPNPSYIYGLITLSSLNKNDTFISKFCDYYIDLETHNENKPLIILKSHFIGTKCENFIAYDPFLLREDEKDSYIVSLSENENLLAIVDITYYTKMNSIFNILRTLFVGTLLTIATLLFHKDANTLVLKPIERMIEKVNKLSENPLGVREIKLLDDKQPNQKELILIENSILKIGTLLVLGFGDAGKEIIANNICRKGFDALLRGIKKNAIYGFCDIRNFTDVTEVLQQDIMLFVNSIANIVHKFVDIYMGAANKNIGDAFLLVWRLPTLTIFENDDISIKRSITDICDLSVISFIKIIGRINRNQGLLKYRKDSRIALRLKNYRVKLGFGLHMGWSIEGAIGSEYKIDASYLSPNVNIASRLEAATKQYGVPLLISSDLYRNFSEEIQSFCRKIDVVTLKGSAIPLGLYTIDIDVEDLPPEKNHNLIDKNAIFDKHRMKKEAIQNFYDKKEFKSKEIFCADKDIKLLMRYFEGQIKSNEKFHLGLNCYLSGDWEEAKKYFTDFLLERINDGPASALIDFMKKYNWIKPEGWPGYRELIEK